MQKRSLDEVMVSSGITIGKAIEAINSGGVRGVFVCDEDRDLLGIVMDSDIRRAILKQCDLSSSIKTIMKTNPFVINESLSDKDKRRLFIKSDKILAPVVDNNGVVVDYMKFPDIMERASVNGNGPILPPQRILIIGGAGYIGSVLAEMLLRMGHQVRLLDLLLYGKHPIKFLSEFPEAEFIRGDCRDQEIINRSLENVEAVVHLGEIVGDPACNIDESFTIDTNYAATHMIVEACARMGISRFIFSSSCSVYGQNDEEVNEDSELNPVSLYARCKIESEKAILSFDLKHFCPTIFRLSTVHGISHRQRFDLVVNLLAIKALTEGKINIFGGEQWRPFISVTDVCRGIIASLHAEERKVKNQVFNLGDSRENYQLIQIGEMIKKHIPDVVVKTLTDEADTRNYRVCFEKIKQTLGVTTESKVVDSIKGLIAAFRNENQFHNYKDKQYHNVLSLRSAE